LFLEYLTTVHYLEMFYSMVWDVRMDTNYEYISIWKELFVAILFK